MKSFIANVFLSFFLFAGSAAAAEFKVLVVMSYEEDNPWVKEIREGIDGVLRSSSEITYFHMNTKVNRAGGPAKAEEAAALFKSLQPHGVITADDDAVTMLILPYLKDKSATPIMFNGVNATVDKYGLPTDHVSGVLERAHVRESLAFIKQIVPTIRKACFMTADVPPGKALRAQVDAEKSSYPATVAKGYPGAPTVFGDAPHLPFADAVFDTVLLFDVLEHLQQPDASLAEACRVLRPQGTLVARIPFLYPLHDQPHDFQRWTQHGLADLFHRHGFRVIRIQPYGQPSETAAALMAIALAHDALEAVRRLRAASLIAPFLVLAIPPINLMGWLLAKLLPDSSLMPLSYRVVAVRNP